MEQFTLNVEEVKVDPIKERVPYETWQKLSYCDEEMLHRVLKNVFIPNENYELASVVTSIINSRRD